MIFFFDIYNLGLGFVSIKGYSSLLHTFSKSEDIDRNRGRRPSRAEAPQDLTRFNCGHNFIIMVIMVITFIATVDAPFLFPIRDFFFFYDSVATSYFKHGKVCK